MNESLKKKIKEYQEWRIPSAERYEYQEKKLENIFKNHHKNDSFDKILFKVSVLDSFYSTQIKKNLSSVLYMTDHIFNNVKDIDKSLEEGDLGLVDRIARCQNKDTGKYFHLYSFASKYCSFASRYCSPHPPDSYPIYDKYAIKSLRHLCQGKGYSIPQFGRKYIRKLDDSRIPGFYSKFYCAVKKFKEEFTPPHPSFKQLDKYLWQVGKEKEALEKLTKWLSKDFNTDRKDWVPYTNLLLASLRFRLQGSSKAEISQIVAAARETKPSSLYVVGKLKKRLWLICKEKKIKKRERNELKDILEAP